MEFSEFFAVAKTLDWYLDSMHNGGTSYDTLVIGGGIVGLSIAWDLACRGQSVAVLEKHRCGAAASWAGVGILPPVAVRHVLDPLEQLRALSHRLLAQWSIELQELTGIDVGYRSCGGVYVATSPGEAALLAASHTWWDELGIEAVPWSPQQLIDHEPALAQLAQSHRLKAIWHLPGECQLRTPHYVRALSAACRLRGVEILEQTEVESIEQLDDQVRVLASSPDVAEGMSYVARQCCVTAGPWTSQLLEQLGISCGILPIRGQVIAFHPDHKMLSRIINEGHRYFVPRDDGRLLVGSNEEETGFVCETSPEILEELRQWAVGMLPQLADEPIEQAWAGLRPASYDSYPYIGRLPRHPNIYVASGHFRAGIHLSAGTAQVLAELITTGRSSIDLAPFRPARG